jgi:hypothetical protein
MAKVPQYLIYYRDIMAKIAGYQHKNRHVDQQKTEDSEIKSYRYSHLIFNKGTKNIQWRTDSLFNKWC